MNFQELINNLFQEEFSAITMSSLLTAVVLSFVLGLFIVLIYRVTYAGAMFSKSFALCLVLLSMVTSLVILTISSNVVLSLGMVGALSIVRFRTAIKEPIDTVFMFWAIAVGIITGAGFVPVAIIATLLIGALFLVLCLAGAKLGGDSYLVVLRYDEAVDVELRRRLRSRFKYKLKSKNMVDGCYELVLETRLTVRQMSEIGTIREEEGVQEVNIIAYSGSTML